VAFRPVTFLNGVVRDEEIEHIVDWPGGSEVKTPSQISFARATGAEQQWGFNISPDSQRLTLTKLLLEHQDKITELRKVLDAVRAMSRLRTDVTNPNTGLATTYSRNAEDIVANYLMRIREWLMQHLRRKYPVAYLTTTHIDLVLTIPAVCHHNMP
jgi:hypothetical protein